MDELSGSENILLVDDEETVRNLGKVALQKRGYRVILAQDGPEALEIFRRESDLIDLVILDMSMPSLSGPEVLTQLRRLKPAVKVLFCSGYNDRETKKELLALGASGFIAKPFRVGDLYSMVREALDGRP